MTRETESGFHEVTGDYAKIFAPVYRPKGYAGQPDGACRLCGRPTDYLRCWDCTERGTRIPESENGG